MKKTLAVRPNFVEIRQETVSSNDEEKREDELEMILEYASRIFKKKT